MTTMDKPIDNAPHRRAWELMAWVTAGSATDDERYFVEEHLKTCADCRDEAEFHQRLHSTLLQSASAPHDGEPALQRLMARIDAGAPGEMPSARAGAASSLVRWLVAAVVVQAVGLGAAGVALWERGTAPEYRTFSHAAPDGRAATIRLVPVASLDIAGMQALLARHGLVVVEASSDAHSFGLAAKGPTLDVGALVLRLRAEPGVLLAEPVLK